MVFVACVRPFDTESPTDHEPLACVGYAEARGFTGWSHIRHEDLQDHTGQPLHDWQTIDRLAHEILDQIHAMVAAGPLRPVTGFAELHEQFDANVGWSAEIDALDAEAWARVQWAVTALVRLGAPQTRHS